MWPNDMPADFLGTFPRGGENSPKQSAGKGFVDSAYLRNEVDPLGKEEVDMWHGNSAIIQAHPCGQAT